MVLDLVAFEIVSFCEFQSNPVSLLPSGWPFQTLFLHLVDDTRSLVAGCNLVA
jgi:hypothetical protein